jgi:uncharacterized membrane protein YfcA
MPHYALEILLVVLIFLAAVLYSMVGHAGASGYLAVMAFMGVSVAEMKPAALILNVLVATFGTIRFCRAGYFRARLFWPFVLASIPAAYLGGMLTLPAIYFKITVGVILCFSAVYFLVRPGGKQEGDVKPPPLWYSLPIGAVLGLGAGLTGTGGGIFLSPILLQCRWAKTREASCASALFILVNSVAGLIGQSQKGIDIPARTELWSNVGLRFQHAANWLGHQPPRILIWLAAVLVGAFLGTQLGIRILNPTNIRRGLGVVLIIAGSKLIYEGAVQIDKTSITESVPSHAKTRA